MQDGGWEQFAASGAVEDYLWYCAHRTPAARGEKGRDGADDQTDQDQGNRPAGGQDGGI